MTSDPPLPSRAHAPRPPASRCRRSPLLIQPPTLSGTTRCCVADRVRPAHPAPPSPVSERLTDTEHCLLQRSMLQQMSSSPSAHVGEVATILRPLEGRLCGDASSEGSSDAAEDLELPQCKIRRNYSCTKCTFYTQNPRAYLIHTRDVHFVRLKIYDCGYCVYASRHHQKLVRHMKMVHGEIAAEKQTETEQPSFTTTTLEASEKEEDLIEEIEECDDMEVDDCGDELIERLDVDEDASGASNLTCNKKSKGNFYSCDKCNYVTHIKARYTKHVKYHSMPMIKCTMCDFRTPYKWNLDRHMKNHGGTGSFSCSICNFTADIRQSLTVHEMNHHTPPVGHSTSSRRRNRVGASDLSFPEEMLNGSALVPKEEEGSGDSRSSHSASEMGLQYAEREIVSSNSDSNDAANSETSPKNDLNDLRSSRYQELISRLEDSKSYKQNRKISRPIPQLIPLNSSTPNQNKSSTCEPPVKKLKESNSSDSPDSNSSIRLDSAKPDVTSIQVPPNCAPNNTKETPARKKNESFFDKLKERLLTETGEEGSLRCKNCGFESKCLSEHSVHEKTCTHVSNRTPTNTAMSSLSSTRCQNCRHRCKSSADLFVHMKTCKKNEESETKEITIETQDSNEAAFENPYKEVEPHPMENVVFVWNNINRESSKFDTPLDISINDDSTLPEPPQSFDSEIVDENDGMNLSPSQAIGKKVFKCPHCLFWATTASRFHVHIVGHLNKKPFECSLCKYKSNWRWDITKHIKLKSARDPDHTDAKVLMTDETGRRNYSKYNKFLAMPILNENGENEFHYMDQKHILEGAIDIDEPFNEINENTNTSTDIQPLDLQTQHSEYKYSLDNRSQDMKRLGLLKTLWKCKKCNYRHSSKEALLEHVREHSKPIYEEQKPQSPVIIKKPENVPDPADLAYRCGHCNQLSNWKHVIQRHCRLKHDGVIKVVTTVKQKIEGPSLSNEIVSDTCTKCPFKSNDRTTLIIHMQQHQPSTQYIFKCYFCPFYAKDEQELVQHLLLHGVTEPEDYVAKAMDCKSPLPDQHIFQSSSTKRHKCTECPYETNSKSQYMYHEQFHRLPADTPYKCPECNYSVSKRHLLHQHMRVHGIISRKSEIDSEIEPSASISYKTENKNDNNLEEIPFVWVSAKNEFHKMFKCRYCSYVNTQKCKIPNHEKIHCIVFGNNEILVYKCLDCKFTCDSAGRLSEHSKTHGEIYGRIYCPVEPDIPDEEQIAKLRKVIEIEKMNTNDDIAKEACIGENKIIKTLYFCQQCPARYFTESELKVHDKFHDLAFTYKCKNCEFSVLQENELAAHAFIHSDEYHTKTKMLKFIHNMHPAHTEPRLEVVHCAETSEITWIVTNPGKNYEGIDNLLKKSHENKHVPKQFHCKECPAKFFKSSALNYHMGLHDGDGEHKCKKCSYAVKNIGNLAKHELLHETEGKTSCDYESGEDMDFKNIPLSGTDLFQRKTEAQKRVLNDKDKLVKPNDHFPPVLQADPQFGYLMHGNPEFIYPTYLKNGRQKEKRYKCHKCPSAFEKREQYKIHLSLHGSKQRYKCELCDYSVKYYANYVQHMRKHQKNDEALAERKKGSTGSPESEPAVNKQDDTKDNIKLAIKTMPKSLPKSDFQQFSISDQQTLRLLQRRCSLNNSAKDVNLNNTAASTKDRKLHPCFLCPYTNQRQDALGNHYRRHDQNDEFNNGNHKCSFCDLVVVQSHFLREHLKTHFNYQKTLTPECYVANEDVRFTITKLDTEDIITDLKLDLQSKMDSSKVEKIFVNVKTGELLV